MVECVGRCSPYPKVPSYRSTVWSAVLPSQIQYVSNAALFHRVTNYWAETCLNRLVFNNFKAFLENCPLKYEECAAVQTRRQNASSLLWVMECLCLDTKLCRFITRRSGASVCQGEWGELSLILATLFRSWVKLYLLVNRFVLEKRKPEPPNLQQIITHICKPISLWNTSLHHEKYDQPVQTQIC